MKRRIMAFLQLAFGISLVAILLIGINKGALLVEFQISPSSVEKGAVYTLSLPPRDGQPADRPRDFYVLDSIDNASSLRCLHMAQSPDSIPPAGTLTRKMGSGPDAIEWTERTAQRHGFRLLSNTFMLAFHNWFSLAVGVGAIGLCLLFCIARWNILLKAQGLHLPFRRVVSIFFIGHFFNSFMPGAVGGDLVKAYFVAKETHHRKTEAVSTVVIDRLIGLMALIALASVIMFVFFRFFLSHPATRVAMVFTIAMLFGTIVGLVMVFRQDLFERWAFFRRLEEKTSLGRIISRVYRAFRICMSRPGVFMHSMLLSLANHLMFVVSARFLGAALEIPITFLDYLTVFPVINAVAAIPITPGGLGTREGIAIFLLGVLHVPATSAVTLSLLCYASLLLWSLVGGVVYGFHAYGTGRHIRSEMENMESLLDTEENTPAT